MRTPAGRLHVPKAADPSSRWIQGSPVLDRIAYRLARAGVGMDPTECWLWPGAISNIGYGRITSDPGGETYVHRVVYREIVGQIPTGHEVDHLCRVRACCNPDHLEAVTRKENARRRRTDVVGDGLCPNGDHRFEPLGDGKRHCRICRNAYMREYNRAYRARRAAAGNPVR